MSEITIHIPDWFLWFLAVWLALTIPMNLAEAWLHWLKFKLRREERER